MDVLRSISVLHEEVNLYEGAQRELTVNLTKITIITRIRKIGDCRNFRKIRISC